MWNGAFIWNFHWAACGAQFWNGLSLFKNDKMADGLPWRRYVSHSHFNGANFCWEGKGHFGSSGEQIWKSIWDEHKIITWSYWSYIRAEWLSKYSIRWCYFSLCGSCRNNAPPPPTTVPMGKPSTCTGCCDSLPACVKSFPNMLFVGQIETYSLAMDS